MKKTLILMTAMLLFGSVQQVDAQFLKKLGKFAEQFTKEMAKDSTTNQKTVTSTPQVTATKQQPANSRQSATTTQKVNKEKVKRQVHTTAQTKTITVRDGVAYLGPFSGGIACVQSKNRDWFVIDKAGNKLFDFPEGYHPVEANSLGDMEDDETVRFRNGRLMIIRHNSKNWNEDAAIIDDKGIIIKRLNGVQGASPVIDNLAVIEYKKDFKYYSQYLDGNGNNITCTLPIFKPSMKNYYALYNLSKGLRRYYDEKSRTWGYMDGKCQVVIPAKFGKAYDFSEEEGLARVVDKSSGLWGYINTSGQWAVEPIFTNEVRPFRCGLALVTDKQKKSHFINTEGKIVWSDSGSGNIIREFVKAGNKAYSVWYIDKENYIIDTSFNKVAMLNVGKYMGGRVGYIVNSNENGFFWQDGQGFSGCRFYDWKGNEIADYSGPCVFTEGMATAFGNCYVNEDLEVVIKFVDTQF